MKNRVVKLLTLVLGAALALVALCSCSESEHLNAYKRVTLMGGDGELCEDDRIEKYIGASTKIVNNSTESFSDKFTLYKISEREISEADFLQWIKGIETEADVEESDVYELESGYYVNCGTAEVNGEERWARVYSLKGKNVLKLSTTRGKTKGPLLLSGEEVERMATELADKMSILTGNYDYVGITSNTTMSVNDEKYVREIGVQFRRSFDDIRVIGEEVVSIGFDEMGVCSLYIHLFDYEKNARLDLVSVDEVLAKLLDADAYYIDNGTASYYGVADTFTIDRIKLGFVNQYSLGCEVLQPIYNIIGRVSNSSGEAEFSVMVSAMPEKYTHD